MLFLDRGLPRIVNIHSPYGAGDSSGVVARIQPHPSMTSFVHHVTASSTNISISHSTFVDVIPENFSDPKALDVALPNLIPLLNYKISVRFVSEIIFYAYLTDVNGILETFFDLFTAGKANCY